MDEKNTKRLNEVKLLDEQMQSIFKGEIDVSEFQPTANSWKRFRANF